MIGVVFLLSLVFLLILYQAYRKNRIHKFLLVYFGFSFILWVMFPSIVSLWNGRYEEELVVSREVFTLYAVYEYLFYIVLIVLLYCFPNSKPFYYGKYIPNTDLSIKRVWYILALFLIANIIIQQLSHATYSEINDSTILAEQETNVFSIFSNFAVCLYISLILFSRKVLPKFMLYISWVLLSVNIVTVLVSGARMQIIFYVFILIYHILSSMKSKRQFILYIIGLVSVIYVSSILLPAIAYIRSSGSFTVSDLIDSHENFEEDNAFIIQLLIKSNSINTGAALVEGDKDKPYLQPYINSIYSICPSALYPGRRPLAGSKDGTIEGLPTRLAAEVIFGSSRFANVGVSTSATALWHGGFLFYLINVFIVFLWYRYLNSLLYIEHFYANFLVVYFTILGYFIIPTVNMLIADIIKQPFFYLFFIFVARGGMIQDLKHSFKKHYIT